MPKTPLFVRKQAGGMYVVQDETNTTGDIWFVDSGSGTDATGNGQNPDSPVATIDYAIGLATANQGDIIYAMPGHAETQSAAGSLLAHDVAGVSVVGLGEGTDRPTLTLSHTGAAMTISAASAVWKNLLIVAGTDSVTAPLTISAADCTLENIEWRDTTDVELVRCLVTTAAADRLTIRDCFHNGYTGGNAGVNFARLIGVDRALIENCRFHGNYSTSVIEFHTTACTAVDILNCVFNDTGTTDLSDNVVDTVTGSTWWVSGDDLAAGQKFSGGSGGAVAGDDIGAVNTLIGTTNATTTDSLHGKIGTDTEMADVSLYDLLAAQPRQATATSTTALTDGDLWTFTGSIEIMQIIGRVTDAHPAAANDCKLTITPDALAAYDFCADKDLTGLGVGTLLSITGTAANAMVATTVVGSLAPGQANSVIATCVTNGTISTVFSDTGNQAAAIDWEMVWRPIQAGSTVV